MPSRIPLEKHRNRRRQTAPASEHSTGKRIKNAPARSRCLPPPDRKFLSQHADKLGHIRIPVERTIVHAEYDKQALIGRVRFRKKHATKLLRRREVAVPTIRPPGHSQVAPRFPVPFLQPLPRSKCPTNHLVRIGSSGCVCARGGEPARTRNLFCHTDQGIRSHTTTPSRPAHVRRLHDVCVVFVRQLARDFSPATEGRATNPVCDISRWSRH